MLCKLTVVTKDGRQHTAVVEYHKGHWKNPMSDSEVEAKFRSLAEKVQPRAATDRLLETIWKLENLADAGDLVRLTTGG